MGRLLAALLATFVAAEVSACSCFSGTIPVDVAVRNADAVFAGVVVSIEDPRGDRIRALPEQERTAAQQVPDDPSWGPQWGLKVTFRVLQWWKSDIRAEVIELWTGYGGGDCGVPVEKGQSYLVYGSRDLHDLLIFGMCSRTAALICAPQDLEELGEPLKTYAPIEMSSIIEREQPYTIYGRPCLEEPVLIGERGVVMNRHCRFAVDGVIGRDGWVRDFRIIRNGAPEVCPASLERVLVERVAGWRFRPAKLNGEPVETRLTVISMSEPVTEAEAGQKRR